MSNKYIIFCFVRKWKNTELTGTYFLFKQSVLLIHKAAIFCLELGKFEDVAFVSR